MTPRLPPDLGAIPFAERRDAGGVLGATLAFVRETFRPLLVGYLAIVAPVALAGGLATALFFRSAGRLLTLDPATAAPEDFAALFGPTYVGTLLFSLLTLATTLAFGAAVVRRYRDGATGDALAVSALWDETRGLILPALGMVLLTMLVLAVTFLLNVVPCLGTLAWAVGIVWALPYLHVAFAARMVEGGTLSHAWARARALVAGRWGLAAGATLLPWLVAFGILTAVSLPFYAVAMVVGLNAAGDPERLFETMGLFVGPMQVLTTAVYLVPTVAAFFAHGSLADTRDGGRLWADLDRLGRAAAPGTPPPLPVSPTTAAPPAPDTPAPDDPRDAPDGGPDIPLRPAPPGFRGGGFGDVP